jgi:hypothetical protein
MAFNINDFIVQGLTSGGARPSLFDVRIDFQPLGKEANQKIAFTCRASTIPASTIAPVNVPYFGRTVKLAGDRTFADWSVTIMNDEDYVVRNAMEQWHSSINTIIGNRRAASSTAAYKGDATVNHYSKVGAAKVLKRYKFVNIFPINIEEMALDWDATNQIQTFGTTFAYDYWEPLDSASQPTVTLV